MSAVPKFGAPTLRTVASAKAYWLNSKRAEDAVRRLKLEAPAGPSQDNDCTLLQLLSICFPFFQVAFVPPPGVTAGIHMVHVLLGGNNANDHFTKEETEEMMSNQCMVDYTMHHRK